jgi:hypothetical protein
MRTLFKVILMVIVFSSAPVQRVIAEADKVFSFLLNEPVSMLHFGLQDLKQEMRNQLYKREEFSETEIYVGYSAKKNPIRITIRVGFFNAREGLVNKCKTAINQIRDHAGVDLETGKVEFAVGTIYSTYFWQWGKNRSDEFYKSVDDKFYLSCHGIIEGSGGYVVSGRLVSNEIILSEKID